MLADTELTDKTLRQIADHLESISQSLMTLALISHQKHDLFARRLENRAQTLVDRATHADEAFAVADERLAAARYPRERKVLHDLAMRLEDEAIECWASLRAFEAAHPEIEIPKHARWSLDGKDADE